MKIVRFLRIELLAENVAIVMIGTSTSNGRNIALKIRNDRNVALEMAEKTQDKYEIGQDKE